MTDATKASVEVITPHCAVFERWLGHAPDFDAGLVWVPQGMGALRVTDPPYGARYFENYQFLARTEMGRKITAARVELVRQYAGDGPVVDVGIGSGSFIEARGAGTFGYDVNPRGVQWLEDRGLWLDPYAGSMYAITLWDVLEHIPDPATLLENVTDWVFISCPVVPDPGPPPPDWRHLKPREHCFYWTRGGLVAWMKEYGFICREISATETRLGRLDVLSFVFDRRGPW